MLRRSIIIESDLIIFIYIIVKSFADRLQLQDAIGLYWTGQDKPQRTGFVKQKAS